MYAAITSLLAFVLMGWSLALVVIESQAKSLHRLAEGLETGATSLRDMRQMARLERALRDSAGLSLCSREAVRSAVSIRLAMLDAAYATADPQVVGSMHASAIETVRWGLWCFPHDGNSWLRLAMIEATKAGASDNVLALMLASHASAPHEAWIVAPRIEFASSLFRSRREGVEAILRADLASLTRYGHISTIADLHERLGEHARGMIGAALDGLDEDRRSAIQRAIDEKSRRRAETSGGIFHRDHVRAPGDRRE